jgi:2-methylcitrate dehydratase PrpD
MTSITAYGVGFDVLIALSRAMNIRTHYRAGWHSTATVGIIGAVCAVARLRGLTCDETRTAIGLAASMAGGSRRNFGTMTKALHPGLAARDAIFACDLARSGFTADTSLLEAPLGYFSIFAPDADPASAITALAEAGPLAAPRIGVKRFPCCNNTLRAADAALELAQAHRIRTSDILDVSVTVEPGGLDPLIHSRPETGLQAKFSIEYVVACALIDGRLNLRSFEDAQVRRPEVKNLLRRVARDTRPVPPIGPSTWDDGYAVVSIRTRSGGTLERRVDKPVGAAGKPVSQSDLEEKFLDCCGYARARWRPEKLLETTMRLDALTSIRELHAAAR